ncbi:MAG: adenylate/guanylate cyclase domain-containing protein [Anaerolineales bacterium]|nr:adenylate/guanylate cyclase domain-containing protein [Anaerolineales bacterium]
MKKDSPETSIEQRLSGSFLSRFWQELFRNTGQYPIAILLIESLTEKWDYLTKPDMYILIPSTLLQAYWIASAQKRSPWRRFLGNLIAPAVYSLGEIAIEGAKFFNKPHHGAYWVFAILIGLLQALQSGKPSAASNALLVAENVVRSQILFAGYAIFESYTNPKNLIFSLSFFSDESHVLMGLATLILGLSAGAADVTARNYLAILQETAGKLKTYSEWLLGRNLLGRAINDPTSMTLSRQTRTVMFMDIRGFTSWSEKHPPEEVASLLNGYYWTVEQLLENFQAIKYKFTADEVMAVFIDANEAARAALAIRARIASHLQRNALGAGIGLHTGSVVEGLLGAKHVRFYDVIGDTVNTASRIEKDSNAGELWVSENTRAQLENPSISGEKEISAKGKEIPLKVYLIQ